MNEINILERHATVVEKSHELLNADRDLAVSLNDRLVSHVEGSHQLQDRDFDGEVKRSDNSHRTERPSVALRLLTVMVSRSGKTLGEVSDLISREVLKELSSHNNFGSCLLITLGGDSLDQLSEVVFDLLLSHNLSDLSGDLSIHKVSLRVLKRVVDA